MSVKRKSDCDENKIPLNDCFHRDKINCENNFIFVESLNEYNIY